MSTVPDESWADRWVSVTGLIEPPYEGRHYGKAYRNVGITVASDNEIVRITPTEASSRLGHGGHAASRPTVSAQSNQDILRTIRPGGAPEAPRSTAASPRTRPQHQAAPFRTPVPRLSQNQKISDQLKGGTPQHRRSPPPPPCASKSLLERVPVWVAGLLLLMFLKKGR